MKTIKLFIFALLLCALFPASSFAQPELDAALAAIEARRFEKAAEYLIPLVEKKDSLLAKTLLGTMYFKGQGVEQDMNKGLAMIMEAAKKDFDFAKNVAAALNMEMATLGEGDAKALYNVGHMCLNGWMGKQKSDVCLEYLKKSAEEYGNAKAAKFLSKIYTKNDFGIKPDKENADFYSNLAKNLEEK